jgi:hypothetical protein
MLIARGRRIVVLASLVWLLVAICAAAPLDPKDLRATGSFELLVKDSKPLKPGASRIRYRSAFASRVHGLVPGNVDGIEIVFVARPITAAMLPDILHHDAKELRTGDYAALVLFLDGADRVSQVNLSYVVPGTTVARTVAWKPEDLKAYFSQVTLRPGRVGVKSRGAYSEIEAGHEALQLS